MRTLSGRARVAAFVVIVLFAVGLGVGYVAMTSADVAENQKASKATAADRALPLQQVLAGPHIAFRSTALGPTYGKLAVVPLSHPEGGRAATDIECDRVYAVATGAVCVAADRGLLTTYKLSYLGADLKPRSSAPLNGLPSRARMSRDGRLAATTMFVSGHSYSGNDFSTETTIRDLSQDKNFGNLEKWHIVIDGKTSTNPTLNVWGVTFEPGPGSDVFYATVAIKNRTWLAKGSISRQELRTIHDGVECPSLSPDGTRVAYKKRSTGGGPRTWRLTVLDLATGKETPLAEARSVDDQAEWLDNQRVLYGLQRAGTGVSDVWVTPADGSGKPTVFLPRGSSPAVVSTGSPAQ